MRSRSGTGIVSARAEHQAGRHVLGHLVDGADAVNTLRDPSALRAPGRRAARTGCARRVARRRPRPRRGRARRASGAAARSISANASSHVASASSPSRRAPAACAAGPGRRSGAQPAPSGTGIPQKTSSSSPRTAHVRPSSSTSRPQVASQSGQVRVCGWWRSRNEGATPARAGSRASLQVGDGLEVQAERVVVAVQHLAVLADRRSPRAWSPSAAWRRRRTAGTDAVRVGEQRHVEVVLVREALLGAHAPPEIPTAVTPSAPNASELSR